MAVKNSDRASAVTLVPEIKIVSAEAGIVDYVASDESVDADQEIVAASGWRFSRFRKNSPFVDSHKTQDGIGNLLGEVMDFGVIDGKLMNRVKWAIDVEENWLARLGFKMTEAGYLKAVSAGFIGLDAVANGKQGWAAACAQVGRTTAECRFVRRIILEQEQIELTACIIGANPNALAKAYKDHVASDEDFERLGIDNEERFQFVMESAKAMDEDALSAGQRLFVVEQMRKFFPATPAQGKVPRAAAGGATRRGESEKKSDEEARRKFLAEYRAAWSG
jgi:hypothetical protein